MYNGHKTVVDNIVETVLILASFFVVLQCFDTVGWVAGRASGL